MPVTDLGHRENLYSSSAWFIVLQQSPSSSRSFSRNTLGSYQSAALTRNKVAVKLSKDMFGGLVHLATGLSAAVHRLDAEIDSTTRWLDVTCERGPQGTDPT